MTQQKIAKIILWAQANSLDIKINKIMSKIKTLIQQQKNNDFMGALMSTLTGLISGLIEMNWITEESSKKSMEIILN